MRNFLNSILQFIYAPTLTDDEFETCVSQMPIYDQSTYDDLARILRARDSLSDSVEKLTAYYTARGVDVTPIDRNPSNIFIGSPL